MGKEVNTKTRLFQAIIEYVREHHKDDIDKAYEYFWDGGSPDEFLSGTALALGFINFEDWLVYDYKAGEEKKTFIDIYMEKEDCLKEEELAVLAKVKDSRLSLFEVASVAKDKRVLLSDVLLGGESSLREKHLTRGLKKGDLFATRLLDLDRNHVISGCVYPFPVTAKKKILAYVERQFSRYKRNVRKDGEMKDYLKDYGDVFNLIWIDLIQNPPAKEA